MISLVRYDKVIVGFPVINMSWVTSVPRPTPKLIRYACSSGGPFCIALWEYTEAIRNSIRTPWRDAVRSATVVLPTSSLSAATGRTNDSLHRIFNFSFRHSFNAFFFQIIFRPIFVREETKIKLEQKSGIQMQFSFQRFELFFWFWVWKLNKKYVSTCTRNRLPRKALSFVLR